MKAATYWWHWRSKGAPINKLDIIMGAGFTAVLTPDCAVAGYYLIHDGIIIYLADMGDDVHLCSLYRGRAHTYTLSWYVLDSTAGMLTYVSSVAATAKKLIPTEEEASGSPAWRTKFQKPIGLGIMIVALVCALFAPAWTHIWLVLLQGCALAIAIGTSWQLNG